MIIARNGAANEQLEKEGNGHLSIFSFFPAGSVTNRPRLNMIALHTHGKSRDLKDGTMIID